MQLVSSQLKLGIFKGNNSPQEFDDRSSWIFRGNNFSENLKISILDQNWTLTVWWSVHGDSCPARQSLKSVLTRTESFAFSEVSAVVPGPPRRLAIKTKTSKCVLRTRSIHAIRLRCRFAVWTDWKVFNEHNPTSCRLFDNLVSVHTLHEVAIHVCNSQRNHSAGYSMESSIENSANIRQCKRRRWPRKMLTTAVLHIVRMATIETPNCALYNVYNVCIAMHLIHQIHGMHFSGAHTAMMTMQAVSRRWSPFK